MRKLLLVSCLVFGFQGLANADVLFEPMAGLQFTDVDGSFTVGATTTEVNESANGAYVGARVGYGVIPAFVLGLDINMGMLETDDQDFDTTDLGLVAIYELPMIRTWIAYIFKAEADAGSSSIEGKGFKLGAGYSGLPTISLNAEYLMLDYDDTSAAGVTNFSYDRSGFMLSVSAPFKF